MEFRFSGDPIMSRFGMHQSYKGVEQRLMVSLLVDDMKSIMKALQEKEVEVLDSLPITVIETGWHAKVGDPEGNLLQLSHPKSG